MTILMAMRPVAVTLALAMAAGAAAQAAWAQATIDVRPTPAGGQAGGVVGSLIPDDPRVKEYARQQKMRVEIERELYKLRADYFRNIRNTEIRQAGIAKLRQYTDPVIYPSLIKIFGREEMDVRTAILDMLADARNDEADTTLTWSAIFDRDPKYRDAAATRLQRRMSENGGQPTPRIKSVIAEGLKSPLDDELKAAAQLADTLSLYEAIPMLISAQLGGGTTVGSAGGGGDEALAYILVGTQTAFVSDLEPVVGDSAVAFDPQLSVITEGTVLRVIDATVVTYRTEVHNALVRMSSRAWGRSTEHLGWDIPAWRRWYAEEFVPHMRTQQAAAKADGATTPTETPEGRR